MLILANVLALALVVAEDPKIPTAAPAGASTPPKISKPGTSVNPEPDEIWHLTLPEAIRIGLDNSEVVRVISPGDKSARSGDSEPSKPTGVVIARLNADASTWNFQAAMMAHVRSIEQTYWALSHQAVVLWSRETAARLGQELLDREKAELERGRATQADIAETEQQLENFKLNLIAATSDLITTERQLRNLLGLPPSDGRRIVTDTAPTEARLEPDWEASVREMMESQPDIVQQTVLTRLAELQLLMARNQLLPVPGLELLEKMGQLGFGLVGPAVSLAQGVALMEAAGTDPATFRDPEFIEHQVGMTVKMPTSFGRSPLANTRQAQYQLLRQKAALQQITHQTTHSLARFFLEIDANYKQFRTAQRLRGAAQQRLEAQRAFYEEGRITIDRLLDAVSQYANAIANESQYKSCYNTSIAAFEEAKGTLLAYDHITIADGPAPRKPFIQAKDDQLARAAFEEATPKAEAPKAPAAPMSYKIKAKIGGLKVLEIEVEANPTPKP